MTYTPKQLRARRLRAKLTQPALASELGVTAQSVKNWEAGRRGISPRYHAQLEELLGTASAAKPAVNSRPKYADLAPGDWAAASKYGWAELKYDGEYCELRAGPDGYVVTSRTGAVITSGSQPLPVCHLLMEHLVGTEWARTSGEYGFYIAWAALSSKGIHLSSDCLDHIIQTIRIGNMSIPGPSFGVLGSHRYEIDDGELWDYWVVRKNWRNVSWEGLIFRTAGGRFARMKKRVTMDYVATGYDDGSIIGALYNKRGKLIDKVRVPCPDEPRLGQVFEASGLAITERGSLRNPRFERWRDDKDPRECVK